MRTKEEIFKGMDETEFIVRCQFSFKFFAENVMGLDIEPYHDDWVNKVETSKSNRIVITAFTGSGKCLRTGTSVLMYDGSLRNVEDIKIGDRLMGDDSGPRNVLQTIKGFGKIYKISQLKGDDYYVNEDHILSLKYTNCHVKSLANKYIDMSISDYYKLEDYKKQWLKGYKVPVNFKSKKVDLDPYFLGVWLGDGSNYNQQVYLSDIEIVNYIYKYGKEIGYDVSVYKQQSDKCNVYRLKNKMGAKNYILELLRKHNLLHNKHIPDVYKYNSRRVRLKVLAGLLDTDGYSHNGGIDFVFKEKRLAEDIMYLCRSLGFNVKLTKCKKGIKSTGFIGDYYRLSVSGDLSIIPNLVKRKHPNLRKINKDPLVCGITVTEDVEDDWYGFVIDGNKHFLLGDFTVTHNSEILGIAYPLWKFYTKQRWEGLVVSNSMGQSTKILERVVDNIENNELLIDLKGNTDKWNSTQINTRNKCKLFCMPNTKNIKSVHVNYVLADEASAYDDHDIYYRFIETRANAKQGPVVAISTLSDPDDLMCKLHNKPTYEKSVTPCYKLDGTPMSRRFPTNILEGFEASMGKDQFRKEYLCDVSVVLDAIFPPDLVSSCFDRNICFSLNKEDYEGSVYIGCDFAVSKTGDYSVFTVLDVTENRTVIRHMERYRGMAISEQEDRIEALSQMLDPISILIDETNIGQEFLQNLQKRGLPVQGQNFVPRNRTNILIMLKQRMEQGKLIIPYKDDALTCGVIDILTKELTSFKKKRTQSGMSETMAATTKHDDCVISLCLSIKASSTCQPFVDFMATERRELTKKEKKKVGGNLFASR